MSKVSNLLVFITTVVSGSLGLLVTTALAAGTIHTTAEDPVSENAPWPDHVLRDPKDGNNPMAQRETRNGALFLAITV